MAILERPTQYITPQWRTFNDTYECRVLLVPDEDGGFTAFAARLPGVVSEGDTVNEALANVQDAFRQAILAYRDNGATIPWGDVDPDADNAFQRWVLVDV